MSEVSDKDLEELDIEEDITEYDQRSIVGCRRFVGERRNAQDPAYNGPSRRMNPDRRMSIHDRREDDDE